MSKRILVVEDQPDNRRILRDLLGNAGYELIEAETGEEALTALEAQRPDLILMDIQLPVIGRLRSNAAYPVQTGAKIHTDHCSDFLCACRRRGQGSGCGLHCLHHQTV
jgi:CheY-like chemotaxis protein